MVEEVLEPSTFLLLGIALTARRHQIGDSVSQHHRRCAYPFGPGVTGVRMGLSGTGASAGRDASERSSYPLLAGGLIAVAFA